jgi:hypothetical protein
VSDNEPPEGEGYDLQRVYAEKKKPFWFRWEDQWWKLPHPRMMDFEVQAEIESFDFGSLTQEGGDLEDAKARLNKIYGLIMGEEQAARWRECEARPVQMQLEMLNEWMARTGASQGEAPASDDSSRSTGRPSKRTSTASTGSGSRRRSPSKKVPAKAATAPVNS